MNRLIYDYRTADFHDVRRRDDESAYDFDQRCYLIEANLHQARANEQQGQPAGAVLLHLGFAARLLLGASPWGWS